MDERLRPVPKQDLEFDIEQALRKARRLWPKKHVWGDYNPFRMVARAVAEHLELCGLRCFRTPPLRRNSPSGGPTYTCRDEDKPGS